jgi:hypothetical protein
VSQYEEGDKRKELTVLYAGCPDFDGRLTRVLIQSRIKLRKLPVSKTISPIQYNPKTFVVYRYSDVLLKKRSLI